jgi:protein phosphatase
VHDLPRRLWLLLRQRTGTVFDEAMQLANQAIAAQVQENPSLRHGLHADRHHLQRAPGIEWVSVGDSPLFLIRGGEILLLNEDHSLAPEIDKLLPPAR